MKKSDLHKTIRDWAANLNSSVDGTVARPDVGYAVERWTDWVDSETAVHDRYLYSRNMLRAKFEVANVKNRFHHRFACWNRVRARRVVRKVGWVSLWLFFGGCCVWKLVGRLFEDQERQFIFY